MIEAHKHKITTADKMTTTLLPIVLVLLDYLAVICAEYLSMFLRDAFVGGSPLYISCVNFWISFPAMYLIFIGVENLYFRRTQLWKIFEGLFKASSYATVSVIIILYLTHNANSTSRMFIVLLWVLSFCNLVILRYASKKIFLALNILQVPVIIIGAGKTAELLVKNIINDTGMGYKIVGLLEDFKVQEGILEQYPVLGKLDDAEEVIKATKVKHVFIATPGLEKEKLTELLSKVHPLVKNVCIIPNLLGISAGNIEVESLFNEKMILLKLKNNLARPLNIFVKTVFDYVATIVGVILISPILLFIALKIKNDSPGRIIYDGERIGKNGKLFKCYKFRSMYVNGDEILEKYLKANPNKKVEWETYHKLDDDPRVTPFGKFMRRTSIDELPQLINVLLGHMSLVGPRPYLPREADEMGEALKTIVLAKPGITGYWQINGRSDVDFANRLKMDCWYIFNWSFWMDLVLLFKTVGIVLNKKGAK